MVIQQSPTIMKYKDTMSKCIQMYFNDSINPRELDYAINYSINKRYKQSNASIDNSYKHKKVDKTLLEISDYIMSREPIVTAFGTMFQKHGTVPNPMGKVVQSFLDNRGIHKKEMFKYPKGSEQFEKYNLLQSLDKIDCNGIYGCIGMYSSLIYNNNVATSITSQGRALVSSMTLFFEMFLANNVKFGSLNEVVEFINHVKSERPKRKFDDRSILKQNVSVVDCFAKLILDCGYRWVPNNEEMEIIWKIVNNLTPTEINRVYFKNNLYEFMLQSIANDLMLSMVRKLKKPMYNAVEIPEEIQDDIKLLSDLLYEYVYYRYMYIDRIDRCDNMIKSVTMVSDTDSTIISLDAWYRFIVNQLNGEELRIANYCKDPVIFMNKNDEGEYTDEEWKKAVVFEPKRLDYNFMTDEIVEMEHASRPDILTPNDNVRYSIINIMGFILDRIVNDYMIKFCENTHSLVPDRKCKIIAKNEFLFKRLMMTMAKKNYASIMELQEGNMVPYDKQLDVKGIEILHKSSTPLVTRKALQKILLEDILRSPVIDQLKFVKDIAIFEKQIVNSLRSGSKEYYKPATVKAMSSYDDPMKIQGVKSSYAWNLIKPADLPAINLDERNGVNIAKVVINAANVDIIRESHPEVYRNILNALDLKMQKTKSVKGEKMLVDDYVFGKEITAVAIPQDVEVPDWLFEFINYNEIIQNNIAGFPWESVGIERMNKSIARSNIVKL